MLQRNAVRPMLRPAMIAFGLSLAAGGGDQLFVRSAGSGVSSGLEQSVGTFIDGVYFGRVQLGAADGRWHLALPGRNLSDEETAVWGNDVPLA